MLDNMDNTDENLEFGCFHIDSVDLWLIYRFFRPQYFRLIDDVISQIVLQRGGVDPDFKCRHLDDIDVERIIGNILFYYMDQSWVWFLYVVLTYKMKILNF